MGLRRLKRVRVGLHRLGLGPERRELGLKRLVPHHLGLGPKRLELGQERREQGQRRCRVRW